MIKNSITYKLFLRIIYIIKLSYIVSFFKNLINYSKYSWIYSIFLKENEGFNIINKSFFVSLFKLIANLLFKIMIIIANPFIRWAKYSSIILSVNENKNLIKYKPFMFLFIYTFIFEIGYIISGYLSKNVDPYTLVYLSSSVIIFMILRNITLNSFVNTVKNSIFYHIIKIIVS
ncbi:hypothetical protein ACAG39_02930 [Caldicellulosiruptoraceae bacterium PP1]